MMRSEMKKERNLDEETADKVENIIKSISMPAAMWPKVEARVNEDPELDFSKYVRRLIRRDVGTEPSSDVITGDVVIDGRGLKAVMARGKKGRAA